MQTYHHCYFMYRISSWNYSFLNLKIVVNSNSCRNISIFYLTNWIFAVETIQGGNYMRKYGTQSCYILLSPFWFQRIILIVPAATGSKSVNIKFRLGSISGSDNDSDADEDQGNLLRGIVNWSGTAQSVV